MGEEARSYCVQLALCPHLHEEADTRMFACATNPANSSIKKISSFAVDTDVKGVKKVHSAIRLSSYKFSYNVSNDIYVTRIL